jgi:hypothetical protein
MAGKIRETHAQELKHAEQAKSESEKHQAQLGAGGNASIPDFQKASQALAEARLKAESLATKVRDLKKRMETDKKTSRRHGGNNQGQLKELETQLNSANSVLQQASSDLVTAKATTEKAAEQLGKAFMQARYDEQQFERVRQCSEEVEDRAVELGNKAAELRSRKKAEDLSKEQEEAKTLLSDLANFADANPKNVPLEAATAVAEFKKNLQVDDPDKLRSLREAFETKLNEIVGFADFRSNREEQRRRDAQAQLEKLISELNEESEFLHEYIPSHITSDSAQELTRLNASLAEALLDPQTDGIKELLGTADSEFKRLGLDVSFKEFHEKRAPVPLPPTTEKTQFLVDGPGDEILVLVNDTGRANVIRNLRGDWVFEQGNANLCFAHTVNFDSFAMLQIKQLVRSNGARAVSIVRNPCNLDQLGQYELVAFSRAAFLRSPVAKTIIDAVEKDQLSKFAVSSEHEIQGNRDQQSVRRLQLENDILNSAAEGYGIISIKNPSSVVCQTVEDNKDAHASLILHNLDWFEVEGKLSPKVAPASVDSAFIFSKRGECGAIYGSAEVLKSLIRSLQRDNDSYSILPLWFSEQDVQNEKKSIEAEQAIAARQREARNQKSRDDQILAAIRDKETDKERMERQEKLRQEYGPLARAFEGGIFEEVKAFAESPKDPKQSIGVQQKWRDFFDWYTGKIADEWELVSVDDQLDDYGMVNWKDRVLEAGFVSSHFKLKNRALGEYQDSCFMFGYVLDKEFDVARDTKVVPCEDAQAIQRYKLEKNFTSRWLASPKPQS